MTTHSDLLDRPEFDDDRTQVWRHPFAFLIAKRQLHDSARASLAVDFPHYRGAGFFPWDEADCGASVNALIRALIAPTFAQRIGRHLGISDLGRLPTLVTLCRSLNHRHGTIHTDSQSKVVTALLYLNEQWPDTSDGCLRFLSRIDDIDAMVAPEIPPLYGTLVAFKRADNSFHGHLPYEGERRVIQIAWLTSEAEKERKTRRGRLSRLVKRLAGALDRRFGADRDRNAAHPD